MGQKINPIGFRLGISQTHKSCWFTAKKDYVNALKEDHYIRELVEKKLDICGLSKTVIYRNPIKIEIFLHISKPGLVFNSESNLLQEVKYLIKTKLNTQQLIRINIVTVKTPEADAVLIAKSIAEQLSKRIAFRKAVRQSLQKVPLSEVKGIKIQVSGRLNGAEIARVEWLREGRVPLQTLRAKIDYASVKAPTLYGIIGIKIWVFKEFVSKENLLSSIT